MLQRDRNTWQHPVYLIRMLAEHLPELGTQSRKWILDAIAVAASHAQMEWPVVHLPENSTWEHRWPFSDCYPDLLRRAS